MKRLLLLAAVLAATLALAQIPFAIPDVVPSAIPEPIPGGGGVGFKWLTEPTDQSVDEAALLAFSVAAKRGGIPIVYTIGANDSGAVNASTGAYTWTPSYIAAASSPYTVTFTATAGGRTLSKAITVTVANVDRPLVWVWTPGDSTFAEGEPAHFAIEATDPDGDEVAYDTLNCPKGADGPGFSSSTGDFAWEPIDYDLSDTDTTYTITFKATAGETTIDTTWALTVTNVWPSMAGTATDSVWTDVIAGAILTLEGKAGTATEGNTYIDTTDGSGAFSITNIEPGQYTWTRAADDFNTHVTEDYTIDDAGPLNPAAVSFALGRYGYHVKGAITTNTTWAKGANALGWYRVDGNITVSGTATLTIEPGVTVKFDSLAHLSFTSTNDTCLLAKGTASDSILFIPGKAATWNGIKLTGANQVDTTFKYCRISGAYKKYPYRNGTALADSTGGGFYTDRTVKLNHCVISGNTAGGQGGGCFGGTYTNCRISNNSSTRGGGTNSGTFTNCVFNGNSSSSDGGAGSGTFTNCVIYGNTAAARGGAGYGGTYTNCLIYGNTANGSAGGGGVNASTLTNCTVTGNLSPNRTTSANMYNTTQWIRGSVIWGGGAEFVEGTTDSLVSNSMIDLGAGVTFTTVPAVGGVNFATPAAGADSLFADSSGVRAGEGICGFMLRENFLTDVGYPIGGAWVDSTSGTRPIGCNFTVPIGDTADACDGAFILRKTNADGNQLAYANERGYHATIHAEHRRGSYARKEQGRIS